MTTLNLDALELRTLASGTLSDADRALVFDLFDDCYREASHTYLEKTLERLRYVTLAFDGEALVGFGTGEQRVADLPGLPKTRLTLGGLTCVNAEYRRQGLVTEMGRRNMEAGGVSQSGRTLICGRNAHPAGFSMFARNQTVVPKVGVTPTAWQQDLGSVVAELFGADDFDPETFVCRGAGKPIGYPILHIDSGPQEWEVFRAVDRDRGDTLLGIVWFPDAPPGW